MKRILLWVFLMSCFWYISFWYSYTVQPWDNALLTEVYDRIDEVYADDYTKLITFMDSIIWQEIRFAKSDQSKYFLSKIKEYIHWKLYKFIESPDFVCLPSRVQYWDSTTIDYILEYNKGFVDVLSANVSDTPSKKELLFNAWKWQVISWLDTAVLWKKQWKKYWVVIEPRYWRWNIQDSLFVNYPTPALLQQYPTLEVGNTVKILATNKNKEVVMYGTIIATNAETTRIDLNHPLAWETLLWVFSVQNIFKNCN